MLKGPRGAMEPIKDKDSIQVIKAHLEDHPRDFCLFTFGINTAFRAGDTLSLDIGDVRGKTSVVIKEEKTGKRRVVFLNEGVRSAIQKLLDSRPNALDTDPLFIGEKRGTRITVETYGRLVKSWCKDAGMEGLFCSHSLRKTAAYTWHTVHKIPLSTIMVMMNHSSEAMTARYIGITAEDIKSVYQMEV